MACLIFVSVSAHHYNLFPAEREDFQKEKDFYGWGSDNYNPIYTFLESNIF